MANEFNSKTGYKLSIDQQTVLANVFKDLSSAEFRLRSADVDNSMECFEDFMYIYKSIAKAIYKANAMMAIHNMVEGAEKLAEEFNKYNKRGEENE